MNYKTILVHADGSRGLEARLTFAAALALEHDAHLVGVVQTGILRFVCGIPPDGYLGDMAPLLDDMRASAEQRAAHFDSVARQAGAVSFEHRIGDEDAGYALATQAMYADLVIVGQSDPEDPAAAHAGIPEYVALHAPCPVLVLPYARSFGPAFERVVVGWNASPESARAVRQALPLLKGAKEVEVAVFYDARSDAAAMGGPEVTLMLARHGIAATLCQERAGADPAGDLLTRVAHGRADLLVMGCYGHKRFREILLGGVSRTVLRDMPVPVLMAH
ncbi:universal stress protein [Massilia sp. 9096]|uniref:universal stress protein n=1 Tax=Massilia sp. 9096 TaxID=1500894 RepID=UPI0005697A4B|nr:universal stress protein [Massilia sp. 9096]